MVNEEFGGGAAITGHRRLAASPLLGGIDLVAAGQDHGKSAVVGTSATAATARLCDDDLHRWFGHRAIKRLRNRLGAVGLFHNSCGCNV